MNEEQLEKTIQFYLKALNETILTATTVSESKNNHYGILGEGIFYNQKDDTYLYAIGSEVYVKKTKEEILKELEKKYSIIAVNLKKLQGKEHV